MQSRVITLAEKIAESLSGEDHSVAIDALDIARVLLRPKVTRLSPSRSEDREESRQSLSAA